MSEQSNSIKMLRIEQVEDKVGYKKSTIYEWMNTGSRRYKSHFPPPRKNGRSNRWFESEIDDFCLLEFGGSNNYPTVERERAVSNRGEVAGISAPPKGHSIKTKGTSKAPSGKSRLVVSNISEKCATVEEDAELPSREVADICEEKIDGAELDALQTVDAPTLVETDLVVAAQNAKPNRSDEGLSTTLVEEIATSSLPVTPAPTMNAPTTIKQSDAPARTRVIEVVLTKRRTFVQSR